MLREKIINAYYHHSLCGIYMFSLCLCGFTQGTSVPPMSRDAHIRFIWVSKLSQYKYVDMCMRSVMEGQSALLCPPSFTGGFWPPAVLEWVGWKMNEHQLFKIGSVLDLYFKTCWFFFFFCDLKYAILLFVSISLLKLFLLTLFHLNLYFSRTYSWC